MEDKRLDYNQPFLSARRFSQDAEESKMSDNARSSTLPSLPFYKSDLKNSGPIRKAGTVPFVWEQSPGTPKYEITSQTQVIAAPKPPPGRIVKLNQQKTNKLTKKVIVKEVKNEIKCVNSKRNEEKESFCSDDEAYMDAPDTFSRPENIVSTNKNPLVSDSKVDNPVLYPQQNYGGEKESVSDDEESEFGDHENISGKLCGVLPRFCLKNSFLVMNTVPSMRIGSQIPPASSVCKARAKSSYAGACIDMKKEVLPFGGGLQNPKVYKDNNTQKDVFNHVNYQNNPRQPDGTSLYRRLQGGGIDEDKGYFGKSIKANNKDHNQETGYECSSASPMVEKTLYIDSVHALASPNSSSSSSKGLRDSGENNSESLLKRTEMGNFVENLDSSVQDMKHMSISDQEDEPGFKDDQDVSANSIFFEGVKMSENSMLNKNLWHKKKDSEENLHGKITIKPINPPLPKSPSESWLNRTLPSVSSKNHSACSFLGMHMNHKPQASNITAGKTYDSLHVNSQSPKDLLMPIPENYKQ